MITDNALTSDRSTYAQLFKIKAPDITHEMRGNFIPLGNSYEGEFLPFPITIDTYRGLTTIVDLRPDLDDDSSKPLLERMRKRGTKHVNAITALLDEKLIEDQSQMEDLIRLYIRVAPVYYANTISRQLSLDASDVEILTILIMGMQATRYFSTRSEDWVTTVVSNYYLGRVDDDYIQNIIGGVNDVPSMIAKLQTLDVSDRLKRLDITTLFSIISNGSIFSNGWALTGGIESVSSFCAISSHYLDNMVFSKTAFTTRIKALKRLGIEDLVKEVRHLLK